MILSTGNMKIGHMMNVSLTPVESCGEAAKFCGKDCYAKKAHRLYSQAKEKWDHNLKLATENIMEFFLQLYDELKAEYEKGSLKFFRWHVGGDILSDRYFFHMVQIAEWFSQTKFLCFTKKYDIINTWLDIEGEIPDNLTIIFSAWPGLPLDNPHGLPVAWMQNGAETRVTGDEIECPGSCENCGMCWDIRKVGKDVVFHKH